MNNTNMLLHACDFLICLLVLVYLRVLTSDSCRLKSLIINICNIHKGTVCHISSSLNGK